jgi:two-component system, sensor histidine kinase and response regulator
MANLFDLDAALDRVEGDRSLLCELAGIYLDEVRRLEIVLAQAIGRNDPVAAAKAAHTLKGACANFCCPAVYDAAWALEQMGSSSSAEEIAEAYEKLLHESNRLNQALREEFAIESRL